MAPIIGDVLIHAVVGENLSVQRDRCGEQELETVLGRDVAVFHAIPLDTGTVSGGELGSCAVHQVEEGVNRLPGDVGVIIRVGLKHIEGRGLLLRGGHGRGNFTRWWW